MQASNMLLRQSNVKLQDELRKTNNAYTEEKTMLRSQLSCLRLDLSELHHDNRTITTDDTHSRVTPSTTSEELRRLADFDTESGRALQLPSIKNINLTPGRKSGETKSKKQASDTARSKTLRFTGSDEMATDIQTNSSDHDHVDSKNQENQKFLELQKNQEILRNIGRANFREKRHSLIRLPTISSAKKRTTLWDSGNNVSRPRGMSTSFEQNQILYVEDAIDLSKRAFKIPSIKDTHRSEIQLSDTTPRPAMAKRKVQFTRPRGDDRVRERDLNHQLDVSTTEASSLNTTMNDISLEDNTIGNITFDEEAFNKKLGGAKHNDSSSSLKSHNNNNKRHNQTAETTSPLQPIAEGQATENLNSAQTKPLPDKNEKGNDNNTNNDKKNDHLTLPPIKIKTLAKKNLMIHDMNNMRTSQTSFPKLRLSPDNKSYKDSDRSVGTKFSRLSQETESWKNTYVKYTETEKRNKTLTEIMFAVRSRMRENEETIRFGQTPCPKDKTLSDLLLSGNRSVGTPRWSDATMSPRKGKVSKRGRPSIPPTKAEKSSRRTDNTANLQGYLRKMCRQKHLVNQHDYSPRRPTASFHKQPRMIVQQA